MFTKKPTTIAEVHQQTVSQIKAIEEKENARIKALAAEQKAREAQFQESTKLNEESASKAKTEVETAKGILSFYDNLFKVAK